MVKNCKVLRQFEKEQTRRWKVNYLENVRIIDEMYKEAVLLKVFPLKDPWSGIEVDLRIAKAINRV